MMEQHPNKRFFRFTQKELPGELRGAFRNARWLHNRRFLRVASGLCILLGTLLLFRHACLDGLNQNDSILLLYKMVFWYLIGISVVFLTVSFTANRREYSKILEAGQRLFMAAAAVGFCFLTYVDLQVAVDFSAILALIFFISVSIWIDLTFFLSALVAVDVLIFLGFLAGVHPAVTAGEVIVEMLLFSVVGVVLFLSINEGRMKNFVNEKLLNLTVEKLEYLSHRDPLTKLFNRRLMNEDIDKLLALSRRSGQSFSIILMDLDLFKKVNDGLGHAVGDHVLMETADILVGTVRESDRVYRFGGEEFLVLLPDTPLENAVHLAGRLLGKFRVFQFTGVPWTVTMSMGLSESRERGLGDDLVKLADLRLYAAKQGGRDRYVAVGFNEASGNEEPEIPNLSESGAS